MTPEQDINANLLAACEKLWPWINGALDVRGSDGFIESVRELQGAIIAARAQVEDDAKLVDEEWLLSVGFSYEIIDRVKWLVQEPLTLGWLRGEGNLNWYFDGFVGPETVTRGNVRRLLAALGGG